MKPTPPAPLLVESEYTADDPLPDLVVAEHANPLLTAMFCTDLLRKTQPLDTPAVVLIGERDDVLRQLLAPLPLLLTVIDSTTLLSGRLVLPEAAEYTRGVRWVGLPAPARVLPRWAIVPLIPALARAGSVAEAGHWCSMARSTVYAILATTARHLRLPRRWRHPSQWSRELLAALSYPTPTMLH